ncbi:hypothetical protein [uncultured Sphingomonas sp.]|uniref:hypothetical protein n=1 Tax=uncultured Sphingomonas sp. TaxID=158754 RepID=UPI002613B685|nr:hypothetical protein [uncultured Sphingomonas sp.]
MTRLALVLPILLVAAAPVPADRPGPSRADKRLKADVLRGLQRYSVAAYRCARLGQLQAQSLPKRFRAGSPVYRRRGHWEAWSARVCGQRRTFLVAMWPSRRGGVDFTIEPQGSSARR